MIATFVHGVKMSLYHCKSHSIDCLYWYIIVYFKCSYHSNHILYTFNSNFRHKQHLRHRLLWAFSAGIMKHNTRHDMSLIFCYFKDGGCLVYRVQQIGKKLSAWQRRLIADCFNQKNRSLPFSSDLCNKSNICRGFVLFFLPRGNLMKYI